MAPSTILILGTEQDQHAAAGATLLREAGRTVAFFNTGDLPGDAELIYQTIDGRPARRILRRRTTEVDLDTVGAVWLRKPTAIITHVPTTEQYFPKSETARYLFGLLSALDCRWLPAHPAVLKLADSKIDQLWRAARLGFEVPDTLVTNSPSEFMAFYSHHQGAVVSKVGDGAAFDLSYPRTTRYTRSVTRRDLAHIGRIRHCPTTFQANVPKRFEVRATVIGEVVLAAEIHSQQSRQAAQDWRQYDFAHTPHRPHQLPQVVTERCVALVRELGLTFGTIDLIVRPDGGYVFLEVNPNGQYLWIEDLTGLPITATVAQFLLEAAAARDSEQG